MRKEWAWACLCGTLCLAVSSLPYLAAWSVAAGSGSYFVGLLHYPDDAYVYMSWMRQAAEGHLLLKNEFTTAPQRGLAVNLLFAVLGLAARITGMSPLGVFHASRVAFGAAFLLCTYVFLRAVVPDRQARMAGYTLVCFSSGLGWLFPRAVPNSPVDLWQTEAISFLCIYQNPLFLAAQALMLCFFTLMLNSVRRGSLRPTAAAGLLACLLANTHGYDLIIVLGVWTGYLLVRWFGMRRVPWREAVGMATAALLAAPAAAYQYWLYGAEPVFRERVLVPTGSPGPHWVLLGYGLLVPLAAVGTLKSAAGKFAPASGAGFWQFLAVWAVVGLALPYVPVPFQRKLLMGAHVPIAALAGIGLEHLRQRWSLSGTTALGLAVLITCATNVRWLRQGAVNMQNNLTESNQRVFLLPSEARALEWLRQNAHGEAVLAMPLTGVAGYIPAISGCSVYVGHWGETPGFAQKLRAARVFYRPGTSQSWRRAFLAESRVRYVLYGPAERVLSGGAVADAELSALLERVYSVGEGSASVVVYRVGKAGVGTARQP